MKKYIDLADQVWDEVGIIDSGFVQKTLNWLDDHPDQVPGRTITKSEIEASVVHARQCASFTTNPVGFVRSALDILGITVVPDPEPTNAERLADVLREFWTPVEDPTEFAELLDERGVKAPELDSPKDPF